MKNITKKVALGTVLGAALVLVPIAASAHVGVDADDEAVAGGETTLTFGFSHGCDGSPTTALAIEMPDGLSGVHPVADAGWTIDVERGGEAGRVSTVTFTAETPIPNDVRGEVELVAGFADDATGPLAFPVEQVCEEGSTAWSEIAAEGQDPRDLEAPAPVLELTDPVDDDASGHEPAADDDAEPGGSDVVALALSTVAVAVSLAALGTTIVRTRRRA